MNGKQIHNLIQNFCLTVTEAEGGGCVCDKLYFPNSSQEAEALHKSDWMYHSMAEVQGGVH